MNFASSGESHGLGEVQRNTELGAALEPLTQAIRVCFQHGFQSGTASLIRLLDRAAIGDERETIGQAHDDRAAIRRRSRSHIMGRVRRDCPHRQDAHCH